MSTQHLTDEQLSAQLDSALGGDESTAVTSHLATCADCTARIDMLRATSQAVANLPEVEMPRPLDLGFLRGTPQRAAAETPRGLVARIIHGRTPTWVPTAMAFAAVLVLAINVAPRLLPPGGGASRTAAGLGAGGAKQASPPSGFQDLAPQATGAPGAAAGALNSSRGAPVPSAQKSVAGPDGSSITLAANPQAASAGQPVQLLLKLVGGHSDISLAPQGMQVHVTQGSTQLRLAGTIGTNQQVKSGQELDLTSEWSAGAVAGPPAPGTYSLMGRVFLADGRVIEVTLPFTVR